jgi:hypothetical protein
LRRVIGQGEPDLAKRAETFMHASRPNRNSQTGDSPSQKSGHGGKRDLLSGGIPLSLPWLLGAAAPLRPSRNGIAAATRSKTVLTGRALPSASNMPRLSMGLGGSSASWPAGGAAVTMQVPEPASGPVALMAAALLAHRRRFSARDPRGDAMDFVGRAGRDIHRRRRAG